MALSRIRAITNPEFLQMMAKCRPPTGWPSTIAVASSAGPDSACLLFLLRQMIDWKHENNNAAPATSDLGSSSADLPDAILSLHVDHDLQSDAKKMASAARTAATRFKAAAHAELRVPWGSPPFPPHPHLHPRLRAVTAGETGEEAEAVAEAVAEVDAAAAASMAIEAVARTARYRLMFDAMTKHRRVVRVLATGHHADDQVETVLMRLGGGSSVLGLGGMRPVRRWGMALGNRAGSGSGGEGEGESDFGWFGHEGLERWIVRPLLDVSKDRILATCDLHNIDYFLDRTNFQPDLTLRNAIRYVISSNDKKRHSAEEEPKPVEPALPPVLADKMIRIKSASEDLKIPIPIDLMASREDLHEAVHYSSRNLSDIENRATAHLNRFSIQAPPGTFILAADKLSVTVTDPFAQLTMVLRILRYVSPHPWGSTRAQAGRRRESLQRIVQRVWDPDPASEARARFEAGANVLWTPLRICRDGRLKHGQPKWHERFGWLASRASPQKHCERGFDRDISTELLPPRKRAEVLYDNRFLITFRLDAVPAGDPVLTSVIEGSGRVMLILGGKWFWPQVVWRRKGNDDVVIAHIFAPELDWYEPAPGMRKNYSTRPSSEEVQKKHPLWQDMVDFKFIRVLEEP